MKGKWTVLSGRTSEVELLETKEITLRKMEMANIVIDPDGRVVKNRWGAQFNGPIPSSNERIVETEVITSTWDPEELSAIKNDMKKKTCKCGHEEGQHVKIGTNQCREVIKHALGQEVCPCAAYR